MIFRPNFDLGAGEGWFEREVLDRYFEDNIFVKQLFHDNVFIKRVVAVAGDTVEVHL